VYNKDSRGYIPQFDFIKGIAIISVILLHAGIGLKYFSPYWIGLSVPLFICVSYALNCLVVSRGGGGGVIYKKYLVLINLKKCLCVYLPRLFWRK
jgi:peptidoglycan/LPS O-acetylase OafA/YrhL